MIACRATERFVKERIRTLPKQLEPIPADSPAWDLSLTLLPVAAWSSQAFLVQLYEEPRDGGSQLRLSVQRTGANAAIRPRNRDLRPISWDELMEVKRQVGYGDCWAVEMYPPDREVVDVAPMRHLWVLSAAPPQAWRKEVAR